MRAALAEQTWVDYKPAGFGSRSVAYILDFFIRWGGIAVLVILLLLLPGLLAALQYVQEFFSTEGSAFGSTAIFALLVLFVFAVEWSYPVYFEVFHDGVSPGKWIMGLRVVSRQGLPITWRASLLRTMLTTIDLMPGVGLFAFVSMLATRYHLRLGDLVAGTMVIHDAERFDPAHLWDTEAGTRMVLVPLDRYRLLDAFLARAPALDPYFRRLGEVKLRDALRPYSLELPPPADDARLSEWLQEVHEHSRPMRKQFGPSGSRRHLDMKPIREELSSARSTLETMVDSGEKSRSELYETAIRYQKVCQVYAHLSTFYPHTREADFAAHVVRFGRRLIYGRRLDRSRAKTHEPFVDRIAAGFHTIRYHILFIALVGIGGAAIAALFVQLNPALAWLFLSEEVAAQLAEGRIWTEDIVGMESVAASKIMTNNITVSFLAFAIGVSSGLGSFLVILFNGAQLGGVFAALTHYGMAHRLLHFILAHGFLELSIIAVCGGCGFYLGDALIAPGGISRTEALRKRAGESLELVLFSALCLIPCGLVEGYLSPAPAIPVPVKLITGLGIAYLYWSVVITGRVVGWSPIGSLVRLGRRVAAVMDGDGVPRPRVGADHPR